MKEQITRRSWFHRAATTIATVLTLASGIWSIEAAPKPKTFNLVPTITSIAPDTSGQLVATGTVTANLGGRVVNSPFTAPVTLALAQVQPVDAVCPILDLSLGPIHLDLLGLVVDTSPICLQISAVPGDGQLLGNLLCDVAHLLDEGIDLGDILSGALAGGGITAQQLPIDPNALLAALTNVLNGALQNLLAAVLQDILAGTGATCGILHLELGPLDLNLLGLAVHLDDCSEAGGPVTVDVRAQRGGLLGNLLCGLVNGDLLGGPGTTLQNIIAALLARLNQ